MRVQSVATTNYRKQQNFAAAPSVSELINHLKVVAESSDVPAAATALKGTLQGHSATVIEIIEHYFPQSKALREAFGLPYSVQNHPRHGI